MNLDPQLHNFLGGVSVSLDPVERFRAALGEPRGFQRQLLTSTAQRVICMASRQTGKSTTVACIAWDAFLRGETVLVAAPSQRQSIEFLLRVRDFKEADPFAPTVNFLKTEVNAPNHRGRIVSIPATDNARGFTADLLVLEEAAYTDPEAITALLPMRKKDTGRLITVSTPNLREGYFYDRWTEPNNYEKVLGLYTDIPELVELVEQERQDMSDLTFRREYLCEFVGSGVPLIGHDVLARATNPDVGALRLT